ncbi:MAG: hypothetical protein LBV28_04070 [Puniceicoccales bacterium]|jgi:hypothetical protein|nr:hypothetical protein [Puniceicoccales bacterium]
MNIITIISIVRLPQACLPKNSAQVFPFSRFVPVVFATGTRKKRSPHIR